MPYQNIDAALTNAQKTALKGHFEAILAILNFGINLTPEERQALPSVSDNRLAFIIKVITNYAPNNANLQPGFLQLADAEKDLKLFTDLTLIDEFAGKVKEVISDTQLAVGSEAYDYSRAFYDMVKQARERNVPGTDNIYEDLSKTFEGQGNFNETPPEDEAPTEEEPPVTE